MPKSADDHILPPDGFDDDEAVFGATSEDAPIEDEYPFLLPRIVKVENVKDQRESVVTLEVYVGVYGPALYDKKGRRVDDGSGYRDMWNLIEAIRQAFFSNTSVSRHCRIIDDFFEADTIPEPIYPYWEGMCRTKWHTLFPQPQLDTSFF